MATGSRAMPEDPAKLPSAGPPFKVGEHVAMFPAVVAPSVAGPESVYLDWDEMVIDNINRPAESFGFHFVSEPGVRHGQGFENIVRANETYRAWRMVWLAAWERTGSNGVADRESRDLWLRLLAEHPIHGSAGRFRHEALPRAEPVTREAKHQRTRSWRELVGNLSASLHDWDPEGMGASVGAPSDEYESAAIDLASKVQYARTRETFDAAARRAFSTAPDRLVDRWWAMFSTYRGSDRTHS